MLKLRDIMAREVVTLEPQMSLREAMEVLTSRHISGAPVLSGERVVGVISAGDLLSFAAAPPPENQRQAVPEDWDEAAGWVDEEADAETASFFTDMWDDHTEDADEVIASQGESSSDALLSHSVEEVMTKTIRWLSPDSDVRSAAEMMREYGVHRILVVDRGHLVGLVSTMDITNAVARRIFKDRSGVFETKSCDD